ncbi:hypothetical protein LZS97_00165 [Vibrio fluvialis]|uniref:hypothetical protein n=1 Tax=Vibrio fluvialis TaxID=676 RepID=UPI001F3C3439|nr:hypothetical protein [Vibrio fluvialis]MCE7608552.1 hypothetical protein [Vibrio fluvialis]MCE7621325.1 hypothetical protein [Vibrio fluvialis]
MRLYVKDHQTGKKTYIKNTAKTRQELAQSLGSSRLRVNDQVYSVNSVLAESDSKTASAMALGGVIGVMGGVPGVLLGGLIGGLLGKSNDDEDLKKVNEFNRSKHAS